MLGLLLPSRQIPVLGFKHNCIKRPGYSATPCFVTRFLKIWETYSLFFKSSTGMERGFLMLLNCSVFRFLVTQELQPPVRKRKTYIYWPIVKWFLDAAGSQWVKSQVANIDAAPKTSLCLLKSVDSSSLRPSVVYMKGIEKFSANQKQENVHHHHQSKSCAQRCSRGLLKGAAFTLKVNSFCFTLHLSLF